MYTGREFKNEAGNKVSRQVECGTRQGVKIRDGRKIANKSTLQRVKIIAIEMTILGKQIIPQSAMRASIRKSRTNNNPAISIRNIDRFSWLRRNHRATNMHQINMPLLNQNELLIIVSHGARYIPFFAFKTPRLLANELYFSGMLPNNYNGQIYLDGCHTGEPRAFGHVGDGTSYAEMFGDSLRNLSINHGGGINPILGGFTVKGNLGAAMTSNRNDALNGTEWIERDRRSIRLIGENMNNMANSVPPIPFSTNPNNPHSRLRNTTSFWGLIKKQEVDYRGRFAKVIY